MSALAALFAAWAPLHAADRPPNIVIIFTDDQGYGDVGCFGAKSFATPNLDRLAREGRRFTNFHVAQPVCSASRAALLTGCYPNRIGIHLALGPNANVGIADGETTIAQLLKHHGYATGMAGKWHLGHHPLFLPTHHGFDEYLGLRIVYDMGPSRPQCGNLFPAPNPPIPLIEGDRVIDPIVSSDDQCKLTGLYTERAVSFINRNKERPFFFYLAHSMPHVPLHVSDGYGGQSRQGLYGDVIQEVDASVGEVLRALAANGLEENTLCHLRRPTTAPGSATAITPARLTRAARGQGNLLGRRRVRVPCIMRWPGKLPAGTTSDAMVMTIDLLPTIVRLVAVRNLPKQPIDGLDVWPLLAGAAGATNPHDAYVYYYEQVRELQAVASGDGHWKLQLPHNYRSLA